MSTTTKALRPDGIFAASLGRRAFHPQGHFFHSVLLLIIGLSLLTAFPAFGQERIVHNPPQKAIQGETLTLSCSLEGLATSVRLARIYYRRSEEDQYKFVFMREVNNRWMGTIPAADVRGNRLQYFIAIRLQDERILTFPENSGEFSPEEITLVQRSNSTTPSIMSTAYQFLAPLPDQILKPNEVMIAAAISPDMVDADSVILLLNGRNISSFVTKSEYILTYVPENLSAGTHRLILAAKDKSGKQLDPVQLLFFVQSDAKPKKVRSNFTGRVFTEGRYENIYQQDQSFAMGGAEFNGNYGSIDVRGRVFLTSLEDTDYQPRHRFSLAVEHDYFSIEAGDVYPRYNDLMIWGKRVRGLAGRLQLGAFELDAVFGQTYRGVEGSTFSSNGVESQIGGTFQQNLIGIRPGLKFKRVTMGLSVLKIKDDTESIKIGFNPKDNLVLGPDFLMSLDKNRIELRACAAYSILTNNAEVSAFSKHDIQEMFSGDVDVPINPAAFDKILIINDSTVPLNPLKFTSGAYDVNLKLNYFRNLLRVGYKKISSDYYSLANSWLRKDIRGFYFSDRIRLFQNKFYMTLGLERITDNFSKEGTKPAVDLNSLNLALSYYPGQGLPSITVNFRDYNRVNGISDVQIDSLMFNQSMEADTTDRREDSRQRDINIQLGYQLNFLNADHFVSLGYVTAIKNDNFAGSRLPGYFSQEMNSSVNMLTWSSKYQIPLRTTISLSTNKNVLGDGASDFKYSALSLFGEYKFYQNKLAAYGEYRFTKTDGQTYSGESVDAARNHIRAGAAVYLPAHQTVTLEAYFITFNSNDTASLDTSSYTDNILRLRYEKFF